MGRYFLSAHSTWQLFFRLVVLTFFCLLKQWAGWVVDKFIRQTDATFIEDVYDGKPRWDLLRFSISVHSPSDSIFLHYSLWKAFTRRILNRYVGSKFVFMKQIRSGLSIYSDKMGLYQTSILSSSNTRIILLTFMEEMEKGKMTIFSCFFYFFKFFYRFIFILKPEREYCVVYLRYFVAWECFVWNWSKFKCLVAIFGMAWNILIDSLACSEKTTMMKICNFDKISRFKGFNSLIHSRTHYVEEAASPHLERHYSIISLVVKILDRNFNFIDDGQNTILYTLGYIVKWSSCRYSKIQDRLVAQ